MDVEEQLVDEEEVRGDECRVEGVNMADVRVD